MNRRCRLAAIVTPALMAAGCADHPDKHTLASLHRVPADTTEVNVQDGLDKAMQSYRRYLDETPEGAMTPEAMRRLADLKLEKEYGILGDGKHFGISKPRPRAVYFEASLAQTNETAAFRDRPDIALPIFDEIEDAVSREFGR